MAAATLPRPRRVASQERWQAALIRALDRGVRVFQVSGTGAWIATSTSKPGVAYTVSLDDCECEACQLGGDEICVHRAALRCELGLLWPEALAA